MSRSYTIDELISGYYEKIFSEAAEAPLPKFSLKHRMRMSRIFKLYAKNKERILKNDCSASYNADLVHHKPLSLRKRIMIAAAIILLLAFMTGFVIMFISNSFRGIVYSDNTYLFAFDVGDSPSIIEAYTLSVIPDGYELYETTRSDVHSFTVYKNGNKELAFTQTVKSVFNSHINTEGFTMQELVIGNCDAVCVEFERETETNSLVIWNNCEYILELYGNFTKEELVNLANSNEIRGF